MLQFPIFFRAQKSGLSWNKFLLSHRSLWYWGTHPSVTTAAQTVLTAEYCGSLELGKAQLLCLQLLAQQIVFQIVSHPFWSWLAVFCVNISYFCSIRSSNVLYGLSLNPCSNFRNLDLCLQVGFFPLGEFHSLTLLILFLLPLIMLCY